MSGERRQSNSSSIWNNPLLSRAKARANNAYNTILRWGDKSNLDESQSRQPRGDNTILRWGDNSNLNDTPSGQSNQVNSTPLNNSTAPSASSTRISESLPNISRTSSDDDLYSRSRAEAPNGNSVGASDSVPLSNPACSTGFTAISTTNTTSSIPMSNAQAQNLLEEQLVEHGLQYAEGLAAARKIANIAHISETLSKREQALQAETLKLREEQARLEIEKLTIESRILQSEKDSNERYKALQEQMNTMLNTLVSLQTSISTATTMSSSNPYFSPASSVPSSHSYPTTTTMSTGQPIYPYFVPPVPGIPISTIVSNTSRINENQQKSTTASGDPALSVDISHQIINLLQKIIDNQTLQQAVPSNLPSAPPLTETNNTMEECISSLAPGGIYSGPSRLRSTPIPKNQSSLNNDLSAFLSSRLPSIDIEKFIGDKNHYDAFKVKFQTLMAATTSTPEEQAKTLYQALGNEVISQLDHIPNLSDPGAYDRLWQSLDEEFGKFQHGHTGYVTELTNKLQNLPPVRSSTEIHQLYKLLKSYYTSLEQIGQQHEMEHSSIRTLILGRLTGKLSGLTSSLINHNPYSPVIKRILEYMKSHERDLSLEEMARGRTPEYFSSSNFLNLDEEEKRLASEPVNAMNSRSMGNDSRVRFDERTLYRSSAGQGRNDRSPPTGRRWNRNDYVSQNSDPGFLLEKEQRFSKRCLFCCSDDHEPDACTRLASPQDYKNILYKFRLCFNCLHQNHPNFNCLLPKKCTKNCNDSTKHSSVVCLGQQ